MRKMKILVSSLLAGFIGFANVGFSEEVLQLDNMNFNYQIDPQKGAKPSWYPVSVFSDGSKTYIEFSNNVNTRNMPQIYVKPEDASLGTPLWQFHKNYLVINQKVKQVKLVKGSHIVTVTSTQDPKQYIAPPPKYLAKNLEGASVYGLAGIAKNENTTFSSLFMRLAFDYNWALSRHWLLGVGIGSYYMPKFGGTSSDNRDFQKSGLDLYMQVNYLFFNGVYLSVQGGTGWSHDQWVNKSDDSTISKSGFQPEFGVGTGYLITKNVSLDFNITYLFKGGGLFGNISLLGGVGYHF